MIRPPARHLGTWHQNFLAKLLFRISISELISAVDISQLISDSTRDNMAHRAIERNALTIADRMRREFSGAEEARKAATGGAFVVHAREMQRLGLAVAQAKAANWIDDFQRAANAATQFGYTELARPLENAALAGSRFAALGSNYAGCIVDMVNRAAIPFQSEINHMTGLADQFLRHAEWLQSITQPSYDFFAELDSYLIKEGWYLPVDLDLKFDLADLYDEEDFQTLEETLRDFFRARLTEAEALITAAYPHRAHIIKDAFEAHRGGKYTLSIPTFLTQADGISDELWQEYFFRRQSSNRQINRLMETHDLSPTVCRHLLRPGQLREPFSRGAQPPVLNRHAILHGASTNYHTEPNSLRCIALLEFLMSLAPVFTEADEIVSDASP
jgi:hypothetical protein